MHDRKYFENFARELEWKDCEYELRSILVEVMIGAQNALILGYEVLSKSDIDYIAENHDFIMGILSCSTPAEIDVYCALRGIN